MIVELFIPCFLDQFYPQTAMNMVKVLEKVGCGVNYNPNQTCCGKPALLTGYTDHCKEVGAKFIREFEIDRPIVAPDASCVVMVKNYYRDMFHNSVVHNEYKNIKKNIYEFSDFLVNVMHVTDVNAQLQGIATYQDSCAALRGLNIKTAPRTLLSKVKGLTLIEMAESEVCCGFGGALPAYMPQLANHIAHQKTEHIAQTEADYLISTDMGCLQHLQQTITQTGLKTKVMHLADVLAQGW
jgi:L-lactate dehydrogenase complex protein LldE